MSQRSSQPPGAPPEPVIRASELAQYSFCQRAWWLGTVKGLPSQSQAALDRGTRLHQQHGRLVDTAGRWRRLGLVLLAGGFLIMLTTVLFCLWG